MSVRSIARRVLAAITKCSYCNRDKATFMLRYLAGMRVAKVAAQQVSDVYEAHGCVKEIIGLSATQTECGDARTLLLNAQAHEEIRIYSRTLKREVDAPLFVSKWSKQMSASRVVLVFGRFYKLAGLSNTCSHSGRRSFLIVLAHKNLSVFVLAALAGQKRVSATQRYIEVGDHQLRAALEMFQLTRERYDRFYQSALNKKI